MIFIVKLRPLSFIHLRERQIPRLLGYSRHTARRAGRGWYLVLVAKVLAAGGLCSRVAKGPFSAKARSSLRCVVRDFLLLVERLDLLSTSVRMA